VDLHVAAARGRIERPELAAADDKHCRLARQWNDARNIAGRS